MVCLMRGFPVREPSSTVRMVIVPKGDTSPAFAGTKRIGAFEKLPQVFNVVILTIEVDKSACTQKDKLQNESTMQKKPSGSTWWGMETPPSRGSHCSIRGPPYMANAEHSTLFFASTNYL